MRWIAVIAALLVLAVPARATASDRLDVNASRVLGRVREQCAEYLEELGDE